MDKRGLPATNIEKKGERDGNIKLNAQNISLKGGAKTNRGFKINSTIENRAASFDWRLAQLDFDKILENIGANSELESVSRAAWSGLEFMFGSRN
ncbi:unnamed protein product [Thlaspi arvense]|uniref:Uncharacterized protein n=1 Tax=Thlaspi arvense TaxID=13288 RepID=A0AAU9SVP4_THLAR|nr:unnamed protein product [Thlaspi arvense]